MSRGPLFFLIATTKSTRLQRDARQSAENQHTRGSRGQVDDAAAHERSPIIDPHDNAAAIAFVGDAHPRAKRKRAMGRRKATRVSALAARGLLARLGVNGSDSGLCNRGG